MEQEEQAYTKGISMYPSDWAALEAFAKENGLGLSGAFRMLFRQFLNLERERVGLATIEEDNGGQARVVTV